MSGAVSPTAASTPRRGPWPLARRSLAACWHSLAFSALISLGLGPVLAVVIAIVEAWDLIVTLAGQRPGGPYLNNTGVTPILLILCTLLYLRWLANLTRSLAGQWCRTLIRGPYGPGRRTSSASGDDCEVLAADPATWRDLLWLTVNVVAGTPLVVVPVAMVLYGIVFAILPAIGIPVAHLAYVGIITAKGPGAGLIGLALTVAGLWLAGRSCLPSLQVGRLPPARSHPWR